jgi:hypothetical protein
MRPGMVLPESLTIHQVLSSHIRNKVATIYFHPDLLLLFCFAARREARSLWIYVVESRHHARTGVAAPRRASSQTRGARNNYFPAPTPPERKLTYFFFTAFTTPFIVSVQGSEGRKFVPPPPHRPVKETRVSISRDTPAVTNIATFLNKSTRLLSLVPNARESRSGTPHSGIQRRVSPLKVNRRFRRKSPPPREPQILHKIIFFSDFLTSSLPGGCQETTHGITAKLRPQLLCR